VELEEIIRDISKLLGSNLRINSRDDGASYHIIDHIPAQKF